MTEIKTGIRRKSDVPTKADVFAFADDGEHATVWAVTRTGGDEVSTLRFRCEAGLIDQDGEIRSTKIETTMPTDEFARQLANSNPEASVEAARNYWEDDDD